MIQLSDGYAISVDSNCYTVGIPKKQTITNKKTGESKETTIMTGAKYYTTLDKALIGWWHAMRKKELSNFEGSLNDAIDVIKELDDKVKKIISKIEITYNNTELMDEIDTNQESRKRGRPKKNQN